MNDLADRLTRVERVEEPPRSMRAIRPRNAATLVLIDRSGSEPRVLVGRRHSRHAFMAGKFVFPGGSVDPADQRMPAMGALAPECERRLGLRLARPGKRIARALALAAIRETFEETGLLIGRRGEGAPPPSGPPDWTAFFERGVIPDLSKLTFVARAITPPGRPRRFDTRFFLADRRDVAVELEDPTGENSEFVELKWMSLAEADSADLPTVSKVVLAEVEKRAAAAAPSPPVPFYFFRNGRFWREELA